MLRSNDAARFWKWFASRQDDFRFFREMEQDEIVTLFDELTEQLHLYCNSLYFEMRIDDDNSGEMVITANCDEEFFDDAEYLVSKAPVLDKWTFTALIQPDDDNGGSIEYADLELVAADMWFTAVEDPDLPGKLNIVVHIADYSLLRQNDHLDDAVFILLQSLLGERTFAKNVSVYLVRELPQSMDPEEFPTLDTLPLYITFLNAQHSTPQDNPTQ